MPAKSPISIDDPVLRMTIYIDGSPLEDFFPIQTVEITHEINKLSGAELTIIYEETDGGGFDVSDNTKLAPGKKIEIRIAYGTDTETSIFKGLIMKQRLQMQSASTFQAVVSCKHGAIDMTMDVSGKKYYKKKDSDIIKELVQGSKNGLTCTTDSTTIEMEHLPKPEGTSDWDFMLTRAEFNGFIVTLDGDKVVIGKPDLSSDAVLRVAFGESIVKFNAEINTEGQPTSVTASAWDMKKQQLIQVQSVEPNLFGPLKNAIKAYSAQQTDVFALNSSTPLTQDELTAWANGRLLRMRMAAFKGNVSIIGNADVKPNTNIELARVGKNYDGNVFVAAVKHSIADGQWTTDIRFGLDDKSITEKVNFSAKPADGQVPPAHGLQVATVKKLAGDPDSEFRIQLETPSKTSDQDGVWARVANLHATNGAGSFFLPEVKDEVIVGYLQSNPRFPVVLGSLYSNTRPSPNPISDDNNYIKSIVTKTKLKITFDDEKKVITIVTPGGNSIELNDDTKVVEIKDQNSNVIKMSSDGINLTSNKDITLKATGNITLDATGKLNLTSKQDVAIEGMNINGTAKVGFTAKGNATAEISASGQTTVKGGMVMIN
jgi:Rhs element Vgr protein